MVPMRTQQSINGLKDLCRWLNSQSPTKNMTMIEIGSFAGDSTEIFCQWFGNVIAIDPWISNIGDMTNKCNMDLIYEKFIARMAKYTNLKIFKNFSYEIHHLFKDNTFDFVYVDGSHQYFNVSKDILMYRHKVKKDGYFGGHDYRTKFKGVVRAVKESFGKPLKVFKDTSWIVKL